MKAPLFLAEVCQRVDEYVECYNCHRGHERLNWMTPKEYAATLAAQGVYSTGFTSLAPEAIVVYGSAPDDIFGRYRECGIEIVQFD